MAKTKKATKTVDTEHNSVLFKFVDGTEFTAHLNKVNDNIRTRLALHGLAQKLGDTYAGDVESPAESVKDMFEELVGGEWSTRKPGEPRTALVVEAISRVLGKTLEDAKSFWEGLSDEGKKKARAKPKVQLAMADIQRERAQAKVEAEGEGEEDLADLE